MDTPESTLATVLRAAVFAARVHATHTRKGAAAEPYVNHVLEVAALLAEHGAPPAAVIAALLHDTVEDSDADPTPTTLADIEAAFGAEVASIVAEVSDDKALPKEVRKANQVRQAAKKSAAARQLKLADKISNLRAITDSPPHGWDHARRVEYLGWAGRVAIGLKGLNPALDALFEATYREALARLAAEA
ncbi:phosphohydrolase [Siccirubricoccus deserti]|uniref:Bifunctional (P)ppGpp synthetase/guanosine-3',5'-bis(Diphosphate) 3'-pyrophosphohydrolase n=1 Tax=Siccirubricoccus deserti TaxID=2013562 RepID=A0A9X0QXK3_9PROT|nr:HD domain-containing protein [Siccirubricoccus deserti]MBC4014477.1 bifunctional (p)ppGpp synthetase/guanosine-3',5'-bis(diphosphate) 3'-pyrophosphohydrolase [Siccirubricoccus deserti]GGC32588.1 phosphohydrolase [Siccirubricoccus deserti]